MANIKTTPAFSQVYSTKILLRKIAIFIALIPVRFYQWCISPLLGPSCRHEPTCSQYMVEAIKEWGIFKGWWLGMKRLSKCHPWGSFGPDPVPRKCDHPEK